MKLHQPHSPRVCIFSVSEPIFFYRLLENPEVHAETKGVVPLLSKERRGLKTRGFEMLLILYECEGKHHLGIIVEFLFSPLGSYVFQKREGGICPQVAALPAVQISLYSLSCPPFIYLLLKIPTLHPSSAGLYLEGHISLYLICNNFVSEWMQNNVYKNTPSFVLFLSFIA